MGLKDDFNHWPLGRQLQVLFIGSGFLLCLILVIITKFQLDWLRNLVISDSQSVVLERVLTQMQALAIVEGNYLTSEFSNYIAFVHHLKLMDEIFNNFGNYYSKNPFNITTAYPDTSVAAGTSTYNYGVYYSKYGDTDPVVMSIGSIESCFNYFYPSMYQSEYFGYYQGYETKEVDNGYPGGQFTTVYTPLVREWYYKAYDSPGSIIITEPYTDSGTGDWVISMSEAILNKTSVYGVAGLDVTLVTLTEKVSQITILQTGFAMLISAGGMILTVPPTWQYSAGSTTIRVFDTIYTGITEDQWNLIQNSSDNSRHIFNDVNGTEYQMIKQNIMPYFNNNNVTHYLLLCVATSEIEQTKNSINQNFDNTYNVLFWVTLSFGIVVFVAITLMIYLVTKRSAGQLKMVEKVFGKVIRRGLFPKVTRGMDYKKLEMNSRGIETLVEACKDKLNRLDEGEQNFASFNWGLTRPSDYLMYNEWYQSLYPYNYYLDKSMPWREVLPNLTKVLG